VETGVFSSRPSRGARQRTRYLPFGISLLMIARVFGVNVGNPERILRVLLGLGVLSLTVWGPHSLWGLLGLSPLLTGLTGRCPLYGLFGATTCPIDVKR
jgi:hypothetical protein